MNRFITNSESYVSGDYDHNNFPDIDINNLSDDMETFILFIKVVEYWEPYKPYPNEVYIFLIDIFTNRYEHISHYCEKKRNDTEIYYDYIISSFWYEYVIVSFLQNLELLNYVIDNNILNLNEILEELTTNDIIPIPKNIKLELIKYLIHKGASVKLLLLENYGILAYAVRDDHLELIKYYFEKYSWENDDIMCALKNAYKNKNNNLEIIEFLSSKAKKINMNM